MWLLEVQSIGFLRRVSLALMVLDQWQISGRIGQGNSGKWNLTVTPAEQPPQEFKNIENGSRAFEQLTWLSSAYTSMEPRPCVKM